MRWILALTVAASVLIAGCVAQEGGEVGAVRAVSHSCSSPSDSCDDGDVCTADRCNVAAMTCTHAPVVGCCTDSMDCDDGQACTMDSCDLATNRCSNTPIAGCCTMDVQCTDERFCTDDSCDLATNTCVNTRRVGCCENVPVHGVEHPRSCDRSLVAGIDRIARR